jgi:hypothetical protein
MTCTVWTLSLFNAKLITLLNSGCDHLMTQFPGVWLASGASIVITLMTDDQCLSGIAAIMPACVYGRLSPYALRHIPQAKQSRGCCICTWEIWPLMMTETLLGAFCDVGCECQYSLYEKLNLRNSVSIVTKEIEGPTTSDALFPLHKMVNRRLHQQRQSHTDKTYPNPQRRSSVNITHIIRK